MQGVYGDKETTLARFRENYRTRLTDEMKARVVLENDEVRQPHLVTTPAEPAIDVLQPRRPTAGV